MYVLTLKIFFPRSIEGEIAARDERRRSKSDHTGAHEASLSGLRNEFTRTDVTQNSTHTFNYSTPVLNSKVFPNVSHRMNDQPEMNNLYGQNHPSDVRVMHGPVRTGSMNKYWADEEQDIAASPPPLKPNRKKGNDIELGDINQITESDMVKRTSNVNSMVHHFTSPIGLFSHLSLR